MKIAIVRAIGWFIILNGLLLFLVDRVDWNQRFMKDGGILGIVPPVEERWTDIPDWLPWSAVSLGAITMIWSFTIPKAKGAKKPEAPAAH